MQRTDNYLDLAHGGGGRVQGLRLLLVPLLPLGGSGARGALLLIARLLHANHLSVIQVISKSFTMRTFVS